MARHNKFGSETMESPLLKSERSVDEALASGDTEGCKTIKLLAINLNFLYEINLSYTLFDSPLIGRKLCSKPYLE